MIEPDLAGKVVLVTGANNPMGIGAAIAEAFAAQGAAVFITYLRQPLDEFGIDPSEVSTVTGDALYRAGNAAASAWRRRGRGGGRLGRSGGHLTSL